jgi:alkanesulfonate monooxygenase SsuD/methylene tetrahydromethanopterin reductase-like flavin-dependent oxidoreductase (luciferase family)
VTSYLDSAAKNMGFKEQLAVRPFHSPAPTFDRSLIRFQHDERYAQADEYIKVMYKLFESSWRDDAVKLDRSTGIYTQPHICQPSPQRTPLLLQAGTSRAGRLFAAQNAEAIFVSAHAPAVCAKSIAEIRELASTQFGRNGNDIKVLALVTPIIGRTEEEAQAKLAEYRKYASLEGALALFGGWTGIDLDQYGDDEELRAVENNAVR